MSRRLVVVAAVLSLATLGPAWAQDEEEPEEQPDPNARCSLPGEQVVEDDPGDASTGLAGHEIEGIYVAEPSDQEMTVDVTLKIEQHQPPPNTTYRVNFMLDDGNKYFVLHNPSGNPQYSYGHVDEAGMDANDGPVEGTASNDGFITWPLTHEQVTAFMEAKEMSEIAGEARFLGSARDTTDPGMYSLSGNCQGETKDRGPFGVGAFGLGSSLLLLLAGIAGFVRRRS